MPDPDWFESFFGADYFEIYQLAARAHSAPAAGARAKAGLEPVAWYGGLDGSTLGLSSRRLVLISARS